MPRRWPILMLLVAVAFTTAPHVRLLAQTPPADQPHNSTETVPSTTLLRQATTALQQAQLDDARTDLQTIIDRDEKDITHYSAQVMLLQINGSFAKRQQHWLNRRQIDTLVLVPDVKSFYAAMSYWTDTTCFPVLIDDGWFAPAFARAYNPKQIIRCHLPARAGSSPTPAGADSADDLSQLITAHNKSFVTFEPNTAPPTAFLPPPGIVVIDPKSDLAPAGYALAVARHQPILNFDSDLKFKQTIDPNQVAAINEPIMLAAAKFGVLNIVQWSAVTLAADLPYRYNLDQVKFPQAVDDALGRAPNGLRLAVVGRLAGSSTGAIYQAMCSLFLQPTNALLFDDYSNRKGAFSPYRQDNAAKLLASHLTVTHITGEQVAAAMFRKLTRTGAGFDMLWLNTSGNANYMDLNGGRAFTDDMPLGHPAIIHAIHSWSARDFTDPDTLAGRALAGGSYWYFGSISEPYLVAFVEPTLMAERALSNSPLSFAARQPLPGDPLYRPWKLMLIGDPLLVLRDKPADRITSVSALPPAGSPLEVTKEITAGNFHVAAMLRPDIADALAARLLDKPQDFSPSDLASAMWFADLAGRTKLVADVPIDLAMKDPIAAALLLRNARYQAQDLIDAGDPQAAEDYLATVFGLIHDTNSAESLAKNYLAAMAKKQLDAEAAKFLTRLKDTPGTTNQAKAAITKALAPPPPPTKPPETR